jgi:hypothetical protein
MLNTTHLYSKIRAEFARKKKKLPLSSGTKRKTNSLQQCTVNFVMIKLMVNDWTKVKQLKFNNTSIPSSVPEKK